MVFISVCRKAAPFNNKFQVTPMAHLNLALSDDNDVYYWKNKAGE